MSLYSPLLSSILLPNVSVSSCFLESNPLLLLTLFSFQIPWHCRSLASGPTGAWWHTGRRRLVSGASTRSRSPLWTSSMIYLRGTASAWASSAPKTSPRWCRWCGPRSAMVSSWRASRTGCGSTTAAAIPSSLSRPHWITRTRARYWCTRCSPDFPSKLLTMTRPAACRGPTITSSRSSLAQASQCR